MSEPEKADPIYADILRDIDAHTREVARLEKDFESIKKEMSEVSPQTGEGRIKASELFEAQALLERGRQNLKYLELRKESRRESARRDYARAYEKGEPWPNPEEFQLYLTNKRLNQASRKWDDNLRERLRKKSTGTEGKKEKKQGH